MSPPRLWKPGDLIEDRLVLDLSQAKDAGPLTAQLGLINTANSVMLPVTSGKDAVVAGVWLQLGKLK